MSKYYELDDLINRKPRIFGHYPKRSIERFNEFHKTNPHVFNEFLRLAIQMKKSGRLKYSAQAIVYVIRFNNDLQTKGDVFKINNDYTSIYARCAMLIKSVTLKNFFELRQEVNVGVKSEEQKRREES